MGGGRDEGPVVSRGQLAFMGVWGFLALAVAAATYVVDDLRVCSISSVETPSATETETSSVDPGRAAGRQTSETTKVTTRPASTVVTTECGGLPLPALAFLLLPVVAALLPSLKSAELGGLFSFTLRDVKEKLDRQAEQVGQVAKEVAEIRVAQETLVAVGITQNLSINVRDATATDFEMGKDDYRKQEVLPVHQIEMAEE